MCLWMCPRFSTSPGWKVKVGRKVRLSSLTQLWLILDSIRKSLMNSWIWDSLKRAARRFDWLFPVLPWTISDIFAICLSIFMPNLPGEGLESMEGSKNVCALHWVIPVHCSQDLILLVWSLVNINRVPVAPRLFVTILGAHNYETTCAIIITDLVNRALWCLLKVLCISHCKVVGVVTHKSRGFSRKSKFHEDDPDFWTVTVSSLNSFLSAWDSWLNESLP